MRYNDIKHAFMFDSCLTVDNSIIIISQQMLKYTHINDLVLAPCYINLLII